MFGFYRVAAISPRVKLGDVEGNVATIAALAAQAAQDNAALAVFPELAVCGYTCGDLFHQERLLSACEDAVTALAAATRGLDTACVVGAPLRVGNALFNCAVALHRGEILGVVPKCSVPNYREFYERRWFAEFDSSAPCQEIRLGGSPVRFGCNQLFAFDDDFVLGVELCEDLWRTIPPSCDHALAGATVIANLSASDELVGKADYRRNLVASQSARCVCAYVYSSAGCGESTSDLVYGGHALVAENGAVLAENRRFHLDDSVVTADVDCQRLKAIRLAESSMPHCRPSTGAHVRHQAAAPLARPTALRRAIDPYPFVPADPARRDERCEEIFNIQSTALARRLDHAHCRKAVIGISGGLDSTLALLVAHKAFSLLGRTAADVLAVTMPGFGTTSRTLRNALGLCHALGCELRQVDIRAAATEQMALIDHNPSVHDVTFENVQARQRTMLLMNLANKSGGIVVGTGDLSESALGWSTYNGDHMSMYGVNCGVPKTLVRHLVKWVADHAGAETAAILRDIVDTPVSPELLPPGADGKIAQKTEDILGSYDLHDFFLYHFLKYGAEPRKLAHLAKLAFAGKFPDDAVDRALAIFVKRFFAQQFKRNCVPDGPKVGTVALSPRGDWRMPADANAILWLDNLKK